MNFSEPRRLLRALLLLVALVFFTMVTLIAWKGGRWDLWVGFENPEPRLAGGIAALAAWYVLGLHQKPGNIPWRSVVGRFALLAVGLATSIALAEVALRRHLNSSSGFSTVKALRDFSEERVILPQSRHPVSELVTLSENKKLIYELRSHMDKDFGPVRVISNSAGLRESQEFTAHPPEKTMRILGIGDSGMFGWDVPQEGNYLAVLEFRLGERDGEQSHQVLNAGVPGYNTQQQVEWLASRGLALNPNIIVVGWCGNDFDAPFFLNAPTDYLAWESSLLYPLLFERKRFYEETKPKVVIYGDLPRDLVHPDVLEGMGVAGVQRSLARLQDLGAKHDFKILVFGPLDPKAEAVCANLGLNTYNTFREIPSDSYPEHYGIHEMHPSEEGHGVLGRHVDLALVRLGWLLDIDQP